MKPKEKNNPHKEHRIRKRNQFVKTGDTFEDHELLEVLLYPVIPYKDTNVIAHELINKYGSLSAVFEADIDSLKSGKNMTEIAAIMIKNVKTIMDRTAKDNSAVHSRLDTKDKIKDYIKSKYINAKVETVFLILLDGKNKPVDCISLGDGKARISDIDISFVIKSANIRNVNRIILIHNHPDNSQVSQIDIVSTRRILNCVAVAGIELVESYVYSDDKLIGILEMVNNRKG